MRRALMQETRIVLVAAYLLVFTNIPICSAAGRSGDSRLSQGRRSCQEAIQAREAMTRALNRRDLKTAIGFVDPSFKWADPGGRKMGYRELVASITQILSLPGVHQDDSIRRAEAKGGSVLLTIDRVDTFKDSQGKQFVQRFIAMETWKKSHGRWRAVGEDVAPEKGTAAPK